MHHFLDSISRYYFNLVLKQPVIILLLVTVTTLFFGYHTQSFRLDASADALILENDSSLQYYRSIRARYGSDDFLIVTYSPIDGDLFSDTTLANLGTLRNKLNALQRVESVTSLLNVPLIQSPPVTLTQLQEKVFTLEDKRTDRNLAREEFLSSPLYRNLLISMDGSTTALQIGFRRDKIWHQLIQQRDSLREKQLHNDLSLLEANKLKLLSLQFTEHSIKQKELQKADIVSIRSILKNYESQAELHLGGVPMIASDSIDFIQHDLSTFGIAVLLILILILAAAFREPRWVILPMLTCLITGIITIGLLGLVDWPVTVVSSNFISLILIITLSLNVHLIVHYRELHEHSPDASQMDLVSNTLRSKAAPCFYTAITTIVAFASLIFSGIRPVIDFGWMMSIGIIVAFILVFTLFPATLMYLNPGEAKNRDDWTDKITAFFARAIRFYGNSILVVSALLTVVSILGISLLTVENRFIDYFKESTEIYQGMELIDRKLGGTTPLDVIIDAPASFFIPAMEDDDTEDPLFEELELELELDESAGITSTSYWFNTFQLQKASNLHHYLDDLPETGKVLSVATAMDMLEQIDSHVANDDFLLSVLYNQLPEYIKTMIFSPYMSDDANQLRFSVRVFESDPSLQRNTLLKKIHHDLTTTFELEDEQVHLSGMLVLYNNMLQSLFRSQILTIGAVFLAILMMFAILFRNFKMAGIAIIPNLFSASLVLGIMGWLSIPLDLMTITIAAISIGIAVDDSIHYVHRFTNEFNKKQDYWDAVTHSHASIGRAIYYTSITIILGFSILVLSNFNPTLYFGLLTAFAMLIALVANLTLLPLLIVRLQPLGSHPNTTN